jgi:hypothetical protein
MYEAWFGTMDMGMETGTHDCEQSLLKRVAVSLGASPVRLVTDGCFGCQALAIGQKRTGSAQTRMAALQGGRGLGAWGLGTRGPTDPPLPA